MDRGIRQGEHAATAVLTATAFPFLESILLTTVCAACKKGMKGLDTLPRTRSPSPDSFFLPYLNGGPNT